MCRPPLRQHPSRERPILGPLPRPPPFPALPPPLRPEWHLYYWPGVKGRGEYVRLCFEEAGVPYLDVAHAAATRPASEPPPPGGPWAGIQDSPGFKAIINFCFEHGADGTHEPMRAPPAIARRAPRAAPPARPAAPGAAGGAAGAAEGRAAFEYDFVLDNTPAVCSYLNWLFGWDAGLSREQAAKVDQILSVVLSDAVGEGRLAFHPRNFYASHKTQVGARGGRRARARLEAALSGPGRRVPSRGARRSAPAANPPPWEPAPKPRRRRGARPLLRHPAFLRPCCGRAQADACGPYIEEYGTKRMPKVRAAPRAARWQLWLQAPIATRVATLGGSIRPTNRAPPGPPPMFHAPACRRVRNPTAAHDSKRGVNSPSPAPRSTSIS
jgi:hypothetical protein